MDGDHRRRHLRRRDDGRRRRRRQRRDDARRRQGARRLRLRLAEVGAGRDHARESQGARSRCAPSTRGIHLADISGDLSAESTNGSIILDRIDSANVDLYTVNGNISYDGAIKDKGLYRLTTHNGLIAMPIAEKANVALTVRTYNGGFRSTLSDAAIRTKRNKRFSVTLGNGSAHVELESFGGTIALRRPGDPRPETERRRRDRGDQDADREKEREKEREKAKQKGDIGQHGLAELTTSISTRPSHKRWPRRTRQSLRPSPRRRQRFPRRSPKPRRPSRTQSRKRRRRFLKRLQRPRRPFRQQSLTRWIGSIGSRPPQSGRVCLRRRRDRREDAGCGALLSRETDHDLRAVVDVIQEAPRGRGRLTGWKMTVESFASGGGTNIPKLTPRPDPTGRDGPCRLRPPCDSCMRRMASSIP